ncbi:DUF732 domain-containing protein [Nocardia cyriacigeorgica]|uniref:DUF732 domain-containing protein n=1 Tax=Nocardia cyriacigeorgica (strain GUH-2) TaxID=1127134 RepID=H6R7G4_NOCCG|nr:DUF732 domain-containing protein [Nocardia cyriacigeorgica]MBF6084583.1 DUF732 domain-containing protein [Nocardia cyriacigeorgica]MBF6286608.1 DUF732 domain-containing protein [Nocardia cyriacigeorgica]MBF6424966.1 DUF732 domain-containing protein [Nocardia cyriacigeorgica]CCF60965.1 conserved protein of unknown function [Nocardia cyriacigeorgica GUH-2]BDT84384.1 hypothetical protein FMUAM8_01480 [Nocardia cyriacigeorgica]
MYRTRGKVVGVAVAIAASGLLAACGDNDSTASSTPTLTPSTSASAASSGATSAAPAPAPEGEQAPPAQPSPEDSPAPAPQERPAPVPAEDIPAPETADLGDKEKTFIAELNKQGVNPSNPQDAITIGNYICGAVAAGKPDSEIAIYANAMAGADPAFDPAKMPVEQAGKIYIDVAKQTYCQ